MCVELRKRGEASAAGLLRTLYSNSFLARDPNPAEETWPGARLRDPSRPAFLPISAGAG